MRVALNLVDELQRRGHDVEVAAGSPRSRPEPITVDGISVRLFRAMPVVPVGGPGSLSAGLLIWMTRRASHFDVVHVHTGRDLTGLAALQFAQILRLPTVVQTHGMVTPDPRPAARALDLVATRRLLGRAKVRLTLNAREESDLRAVLGQQLVTPLYNGVRQADASSSAPSSPREVLFLARLHPRKRPLHFVHAAVRLAKDYPDVVWTIVGPDGGELPAVLSAVADSGVPGLRYEGAIPYEAVLPRLSQATIYVLPSVDEPFPMTLLEALSVGVPSICMSDCGIADILTGLGAAKIAETDDVDALTASIRELLDAPEDAQAMAVAGRRAVRDHFSIEAVVDKLETVYAAHLR